MYVSHSCLLFKCSCHIWNEFAPQTKLLYIWVYTTMAVQELTSAFWCGTLAKPAKSVSWRDTLTPSISLCSPETAPSLPLVLYTEVFYLVTGFFRCCKMMYLTRIALCMCLNCVETFDSHFFNSFSHTISTSAPDLCFFSNSPCDQKGLNGVCFRCLFPLPIVYTECVVMSYV